MDGLWTVLLSIGVPSATFGFCFWLFQKKYEKREAKREELEKAREKNEIMIIRGLGAAIALGEANAIAIRDKKCNGDMTDALEYARQVKHEQKDFMNEMAVKAMF